VDKASDSKAIDFESILNRVNKPNKSGILTLALLFGIQHKKKLKHIQLEDCKDYLFFSWTSQLDSKIM